jgi:hypothetical protein
MPLTRESQLFDADKFIGITFAMLDDNTRERVACRVTYAALTDRARFDGLGDDEWLKAWQNQEKAIEILASANYDNGKPRKDGFVIVDTSELTPLLQTPGRFVA